jgi:hypothetical protein
VTPNNILIIHRATVPDRLEHQVFRAIGSNHFNLAHGSLAAPAQLNLERPQPLDALNNRPLNTDR